MLRHLFHVLVFLGLAISLAGTQDKPVPPRDAPSRMTVPDGFQVTLFAGEPDVVQPIGFTFDDRGRLWVAECLSYPKWETNGKPGRDRILIFEDTKGTGHFDKCKVFHDKLANVSGLQFGFGGVWVCSTPNLLFIPDRDGDDVPDGPPEVVLDGWDVLKAQHNVFNSLTWGPDGWLYGCNGIQSNSHVGKPGTPDDERVPLNCGVWRYHPTRKKFEVVAHGTTNPWGVDFDEYGQAFITNCVISHLWHVIPGAHFERMYGQDFNPHLYRMMPSPADHIHWAGGPWQSSRGGKGEHDDAGGGHAHVGAMIYLGDNWPDRYRNTLFTCNLHGNRINNDVLERRGSGYVAHHGKDFLFANDPWFRGLAVQYGPDGGVFVTDWTDTGECHNYAEVDRTNGRIYKVAYGRPMPWSGDVAKLSDEELVKLQLHKNDWQVRHARRVLQERAAAGKLGAKTHDHLWKMLQDNSDVTRKLRALWALHVTGGLEEKQLLGLLGHESEYVRAWAIRFGLEGQTSTVFRDRLAALAEKGASPFVRLHLASGLQRLPLEQRWSIVSALAQHEEDAADANLPLMLWYAVEPLVPADPEQALALIEKSKVPLVREFVARRLALLDKPPIHLLGRLDDPDVQLDVLRGLQAALEGLRQAPMPDGWSAAARHLAASPKSEVRQRALHLSVLFGDREALAALRKLVTDRSASGPDRRDALQTLLARKDADLLPSLQALVGEAGPLRGLALCGLAAYSDSATPGLLLNHYKTLTEEEKADAIGTLTARPAYALALLEAVEAGRVPRKDLSAYTIRQMLSLKDKTLADKITKVWGTVRQASKEKAALTAKYKGLLTPGYLASADRSHGRIVFAKTCASCHRLFGEGGDVGPELTGSQRANPDYVLENALDPSAVVAREYQVTIVETKDGRVISGIVKQETDRALTLRTQNESLVVPKNEIEGRTLSPTSMMPEGLLDALSKEEVRDLIAYLASPSQVPLPKKEPGK
jgi:putative membrane-bound dehydrogenase-like protein